MVGSWHTQRTTTLNPTVEGRTGSPWELGRRSPNATTDTWLPSRHGWIIDQAPHISSFSGTSVDLLWEFTYPFCSKKTLPTQTRTRRSQRQTAGGGVLLSRSSAHILTCRDNLHALIDTTGIENGMVPVVKTHSTQFYHLEVATIVECFFAQLVFYTPLFGIWN